MIRLYRTLLYLYPAAFRREYGDEMAEIFAQRSAGAGTARRFALLLAALPEVATHAASAHGELLRQDVAYALRGLRRSPLFALTVVSVTALGVGANTAVFSVADFVLVQPLPFRDPDSLVRLCAGPRLAPAGWGCNNQLSAADYRDFKEQTSSFGQLGAFERNAVNLVGGGEPLHVPIAKLTAEVFPVLGVPPLLGRVPDGGREGDVREVVLGHTLWQTRFGSDPGVLGRTVNLDGSPFVVAAVMPPGFYFPVRDVQLWTGLALTEEDYLNRTNNIYEAVGRLAPGTSFEQARADLDAVVERLADAYPETNAETGVSFFHMRDEFSPRFRQMLQALCGASLCILALACANLAGLTLTRAGSRDRELAVRSALGAGRERLARQMITESVALVALGGAVGVLVGVVGIRLLSVLVPPTLPIARTPELDLRMLGLAAAFTAVTGLGFGLVPALRAGGRAGLDALRTGTRSSDRLRRGHRSSLVAVQVASSVVLLVSSGLLARAVLRVQGVDPGFRAEGVLTLKTVLPKPEYLAPESRDRFYQEVLTRVRAIPGVESAAYTSGLPMVFTGGITRVLLPGQEARPDGSYSVSRRYVTPEFFAAIGVPLLSGRDLEVADSEGRREVAVVSESFAQRYWPDEPAVGQTFLALNREKTVVGVVGDIRVRGLERTSEPQMYLPASLVPQGPVSFYDPKDLVIRATTPTAALVPAVREIIRAVDPDQPVSDVRTLAEVLATQTAPRRAQLNVLAALAAVALLLAGVGIYGLLAYTIAERKQEIGVRLTLGAEPAAIGRRVVGDALRLALAGVVPGLLIAYAAARSMSSMLFGVPAADPATLAAAVGLCLSTALIGASVPAFRAVRVSPLSVIRSE